jgi:hypothetical protein
MSKDEPEWVEKISSAVVERRTNLPVPKLGAIISRPMNVVKRRRTSPNWKEKEEESIWNNLK